MRMVVVLVLVGALLSDGTMLYAMPGFEGQKGGAPSGSPVSPHGGGYAPGAVPVGMAEVIKDATLPTHSDVKIGEAFGKYRHFKKKEWSETRANGNFYIDFTGYVPSGWFDFKSRKEGISARGVEIKFVIYPDGTFRVGMVSKVEVRTDGKIYRYPCPPGDAKSILDAIYENRKIRY